MDSASLLVLGRQEWRCMRHLPSGLRCMLPDVHSSRRWLSTHMGRMQPCIPHALSHQMVERPKQPRAVSHGSHTLENSRCSVLVAPRSSPKSSLAKPSFQVQPDCQDKTWCAQPKCNVTSCTPLYSPTVLYCHHNRQSRLFYRHFH
jgi:hypothetical protein